MRAPGAGREEEADVDAEEGDWLADKGKRTLDTFDKPIELVAATSDGKPNNPPKVRKVRKTRKTRADRNQDWRNNLIDKEHKLDGKSKTINLERCFLTKLRVSKEVWEEIRGQTIDRLDQLAQHAEERALRKGKKTIQMEDL